MTSKERLLCAMRGGTPDRVPVAPFTMGHIDPDSAIGKDLIAGTDILIDTWGAGGYFLGNWPHVTVSTEGDVTTVVTETPKGPLTKRVQRTEITSATIEFAFKTPEDVERFLSIPYEPAPFDLSGYRAWQARLGDDGLALVGLGNAICLAAEWFSPEGFCLAWAEAPETMERLTALASERLNAQVEAICKEGVDGFRVVGGEYVSVQLGPRAFTQLCTAFDPSLVEIAHRYDAVVYYHNHGKVMNYLGALADLGIDALDPLEAPPWGDVDLREARKRAGERLCFVGNLDDMELLDQLPVEESVRIARERALQAGPTAFILGGTASGTYGPRAVEAFLAMAEMVKGL